MRFAKANRGKPGLGPSKLVRSAPATVAAGVNTAGYRCSTSKQCLSAVSAGLTTAQIHW
jgi:hypothetical protein